MKVKSGIIHPKLKIAIDDWQGRVREVYKKVVDVELDSITLNTLKPEVKEYYDGVGEYPHIVPIPKKDLELAEKRDEFEEVEKAQDRLSELLDRDSDEPSYRKLVRKWIRHFQRSEYFWEMSKEERYNSDFILETFSDYMYRYEGKAPRQWDVHSLTEVCVYWVPTKITAKRETFEAYGEVLLMFFKFLEERKYKESKALYDTVLEIKDEIVEKSEDKSNWGVAKSFMMGAVNAGVDVENKEEIDAYLLQEQVKQLSKLKTNAPNQRLKINPKDDPFRGIERNQKIAVEYEDGRKVESIKFKRVEQDLREGKCRLIST